MRLKVTVTIVVLSVLLVGGLFALAGPAQDKPMTALATTWGQPSGGFSLGVTITKASFRVGEPVIVNAALRNVSGEPRKLWFSLKGRMWDLEVRSIEAEVAAPLTLAGLRIYGAPQVAGPDEIYVLRPDPLGLYPKPYFFVPSDSMGYKLLQPGECYSTMLWVNRLRDMTLRGKYSISISHLVRTEGDEWVKAEAGPVEVEVGSDGDPTSLMLQTLQLDRPFYNEAGPRSWGPFLDAPLDEQLEQLALLAKEKPDDATARAVRGELERLRDRIDALLKEGPPAEGTGAVGKAQPPEATPKPTGRLNLPIVPN